MTIIHHIDDDGFEYFTINETGESGMSISALARFCGVDRRRVSELINALADAAYQTESEVLKPFIGGVARLSGCERYSNAVAIRDELCAAMIDHYAMYAKKTTREAKLASLQFRNRGVRNFIQEKTGWSKPDACRFSEVEAKTLPVNHPELPQSGLVQLKIDIPLPRTPNDAVAAQPRMNVEDILDRSLDSLVATTRYNAMSKRRAPTNEEKAGCVLKLIKMGQAYPDRWFDAAYVQGLTWGGKKHQNPFGLSQSDIHWMFFEASKRSYGVVKTINGRLHWAYSAAATTIPTRVGGKSSFASLKKDVDRSDNTIDIDMQLKISQG